MFFHISHHQGGSNSEKTSRPIHQVDELLIYMVL